MSGDIHLAHLKLLPHAIYFFEVITAGTLLMFGVIGVAIGWPIFYYTIKVAVKNGTAGAIYEAKQKQNQHTRNDKKIRIEQRK